MTSGLFVQLRTSAFEDTVDRYKLSPTEQCVLLRLVLIVDHETAKYTCTRTDLADRLGFNRANLRRILGRLAEAGLVEESFPKGHRGWVFLPCYPQLVRGSHGAKRAVRTARSETMRPGDDEDPHGALRAITRRATRQANRSRLSVSVEATATGEVAAVVDINDARSRVTSHSATNATPGRAADVSHPARETGSALGAGLRSSEPRVVRGSAGGGSEATPVHPRSLIDRVTPSLRQEHPLRDPRAMGGAW